MTMTICLCSHFAQIKILVVDIDKERDLATQLKISSLPTLIFVGNDPSRPSISTEGNVSSKLILDVLNNKMHLCGADLTTRLRLV